MLTPQRQQYHRSRTQTEEVAQRFTVLEPFGDWRRGPCPRCDAEDAFCVYPHGAWAVTLAGGVGRMPPTSNGRWAAKFILTIRAGSLVEINPSRP
jgi:hypothetical protein